MAEEICICTEPPSDDARRAGMSWGGVSETIRGACPLCQGEEGCPPECRSLTGSVLQRGGWVTPSEVIYADYEIAHPLEFPQVQIKRGGIFYPRYRVETMVQPARKRFLRRQMWQLHVRYWDPAHQKNMHHVMIFASEHDANNAEQIIKFTIRNINEQVHQEQQNAR